MTTEANAQPTQAPSTSGNDLAGSPAAGAASDPGIVDPGTSNASADGGSSPGAEPNAAATENGGNPEGATGLDWPALRDKVAKGDEKVLKRLSRYSTMESAVEALIQAQNKISSGQLRSAAPENATPEQMAAWRAENGIPEKVDDYNINVPEGYEFAPDGEQAMEGLLGKIHELNIPPAQAQGIFDYIFEQQQADSAAAQERANAFEAEQSAALRQMWGGDFDVNANLVTGLLDGAPQGVKDTILDAVMPNGSPLAHNADMMRWLADLAREINPVATVVPGSGETANRQIASEMQQLESMIRDLNSDYHKGPRRHELQQRYYDLLTAQEKMKSRSR